MDWLPIIAVLCFMIGIGAMVDDRGISACEKWQDGRAKYTELDNKITENESIITANKYKILELTDKGEISELKKQNAKLRLDNQELRKKRKEYAFYMKSYIPPTRGSCKMY